LAGAAEQLRTLPQRRQPGLVLGDRVRVYTWTTFNVEPSGAVTIGSDSVLVGAVFMCADGMEVGERVVISYHVTIADSDFHPLDPELRRLDAVANSPEGDRSLRQPLVARPVVGDYALIAHEVVIADHCIAMPPDRFVGGAGAPAERPITIGPRVWIGARAIVCGPVRIGEGAVVGAAAVVIDDVPPFAVVVGNPARIVGSAGP
jgi:acetyltransferase-like isoleucine patch superfamily enzyme